MCKQQLRAVSESTAHMFVLKKGANKNKTLQGCLALISVVLDGRDLCVLGKRMGMAQTRLKMTNYKASFPEQK